MPYYGRPTLDHLGYEVSDSEAVRERMQRSGYDEATLHNAHPHRPPVDETMRRLPASDWLFELGQPIPEPGAAMLLGAGLLVVSRMGRRRFP